MNSEKKAYLVSRGWEVNPHNNQVRRVERKYEGEGKDRRVASEKVLEVALEEEAVDIQQSRDLAALQALVEDQGRRLAALEAELGAGASAKKPAK